MPFAEIVLPETKPETEWIAGRAVRKVSPTRDHGRLQLELASALNAWARGRGEVVTEWRFRLAPPGEARRPLVPDIAYVAGAALRGVARADLQSPAFAPTVAIEILSPDDCPDDVESKIDVYLRAGSSLVIVVDPAMRTVVLCDAHGRAVLGCDDRMRHDALPDFDLDIGELFSRALDPFA